MMAMLGFLSLILAVGCAAGGLVALLAGRRLRHDPARAAWGRVAAAGLFAGVTLAVVMMEAALIGFDFSIRYVAANVNRATPLLFRVAGLWGALEGSILLWAWILAALTLLVAVKYRGRHPDLIPSVLTVLFGIALFFVGVMVGPANPFARLPVVPPDGRGLNPLLQNHLLMAIHPPLLYVGYVGLSIPYAFAMGTLLSGQHRDEWMTLTRRWTLVAWTSLTAGLLLGARWSYDVLGWGGYWAWDPVENAAFMPWLVATAFIHSSMVQERRRLLRIWNVSLVILAFLLTIFGTFLTRSGILASVHSFTQSLIGPVFVAFLGLVMVASLLALLARLPQIRDEGGLDSPLSREAMMLLNNVVLLTMAFTIFVGTIFPLIVEAATGAKVTVGPPFFNRLFVPLGVVLLMVMGLGTALRWGRSGAEEMRKLGWLIGMTLLAVTGLGFAGIRGAALVALGAVCFMTVAQVGEYVRGALARRAATSESFPVALRSLFALNRQRYYGYLTHLGLAIVITGIVGSQSGRIEVQRQLLVGQAMQVGGYTLRLDGLVALPGADKLVVAAPVAVFSGNSTALAGSPGSPGALDILRPSENFYRQARTPVPTPAVRSTWRQDLYVVLMAFDPAAQSAVLRAVVTPLVSWIWVGGTIMVIAGVLAGWPSHPT